MALTIWLAALLWLPGGAACGDDGGGGAADGGVDAAGDGALGDGTVDGGGGDGGGGCATHVLEDVTVPLSDGRRLGGFARRPTGSGCRLPTVLIQTPYNAEGARSQWFASGEAQPLFDSRDYAFVVLDWRGFYASSGAQIAQPDYGADGYDAVEWIATQPWSDGQVGTWGVSALGRVQYWTAVNRPPHLVTAVPIFCAMNNTYAEYYPGGVLRREFLDLLDAAFGRSVVEDHPLEDAAWSWLAGLYDPAAVNVPMLLVAGFYDLDNQRSVRDFAALRARSGAGADHRLLMGPWHHFAVGGESGGAGRALSDQELRYVDREQRIQRDSLAWFDYWMRGVDDGVSGWAPVRHRADGETIFAGASQWPPAGTAEQTFHLRAEGTLDPSGAGGGVGLPFSYDPDDPSPTVGGQTLRLDLRHGPHPQSAVLARDDLQVFTTAPLSTPLRLRGPARVRLSVSTTGADTDFAVRLTDVDDTGAHLLITDGIRRLSLRDDYSAPSAVAAGTRYTVEVPLTNHVGYTFAAGHRVGLIVTSSNWPRFARNPNTGDPFYDEAAAPQAVTNTVFTDADSRLTLTVAN